MVLIAHAQSNSLNMHVDVAKRLFLVWAFVNFYILYKCEQEGSAQAFMSIRSSQVLYVPIFRTPLLKGLYNRF